MIVLKVSESGAPRIKLTAVATPATLSIFIVPLRTAPSVSVPDKLKIVAACATGPHSASARNMQTMVRFTHLCSPPVRVKVDFQYTSLVAGGLVFRIHLWGSLPGWPFVASA